MTHSKFIRALICFTLAAVLVPSALAATFDGNSRISVTDSTGGLSWNNTAGAKALTVSCWFKISLPNGGMPGQPMVLLANTTSGDFSGGELNATHAYALFLNSNTGNIDFSARGVGGVFSRTVIERPYLERWYHVAVVQSNTVVTGYVDGRKAFQDGSFAGDTKTTAGLAIGGTSAGFSFRGEIQEVQVFQSVLTQSQIATNRFLDLNPASWSTLKGYFKLAYSTTLADQLKNFAASPSTGTNPGLMNGTVVFEETNREGEQSLFDARKNEGANAISLLGGSYSWQQKAIGRLTPGVPFEFSIAYNSSTALNGLPLDDGADAFAPQALGAGWRHSFEARVLPTTAFNPTSTRQAIGLLSWDGNVETWDLQSFTATGVTFKTRHKEYRGEVELVGSNFDPAATIRWITPNRLIYTFRTPYPAEPEPAMQGRLKEIADFNGNRTVLDYYETGDKAGLINHVTDTGGGVWTFNYDASNLLTSVTGPSDDVAQKWTINFTYTTANNRNTLSTKSISGPAVYTDATTPAQNTQWQFFYAAAGGTTPQGLLERVVDPRGKNDTRIAYDANGRKTLIKDALNRTTTFTYNSPTIRAMTTTAVSTTPGIIDRVTEDVFDRKLRRTRTNRLLGGTAITTNFTYDDLGNVTTVEDSRGNRTNMTYDTRSNVLTSTVEALNQTTTFEYAHTLSGGVLHNEPTKVTNPLGWQTRYTYDPAGNVLTQADDIGTLVTHAYNAKGLVTSSKDGNNNEITFAYNSTGFLTSRTIAAGTPQASTTTVVPSELGWGLSETNALNQTTSSLRNINGQPVRITDALNRQFVKTYDANGNLTSERDAKGVATTYVYDDADQRTSMTDRAGNTWTYVYNSLGDLIATTAPAALSDGSVQQLTNSRSYDAAGRLIAETDPAGSATTYQYDGNSNVIVVTDKLTQRWEKTYDALNRAITATDPVGDVTNTTYDAAGRVKTIISPNGFPTQHEYDGRGRLRKWTDPMGASWLYTYDGNTNILDIEDALHGHYVMTYGPVNERLTERNQDNQTWSYVYDPLFRLLTQADPNGTTRTIVRDAAGRTTQVNFGSGRTNALTYDDNNNPTLVTHSTPGNPTTSLTLAYDNLDRLTSSNDTFGKEVSYGYDAMSRVITRTYPGGKVLTHAYDTRSRLRTHTLAFDGSHTFASSYTYDDLGRLTQLNYPNGLTQQNGYDNANRITSLKHQQASTPLIALTYAYDKNGNKTGGSSQGAMKLKSADIGKYDNTTRFTPAGKMIDRVDSAPASPKTFAYTYDTSGNMTRAATPDNGEVYQLAYDEDNRTTNISYATALTTKTIANRYDALGRRVSRIADGIETRYVLDLLGDMERILCDTDASGNIATWYVHGPAGLSYKVDATAKLTCYHADAQGNIIRTTTTDGPDADTVPDTVNEYAYTPYGRRLAVTGPTGDPYRFVGSQGVMEELPNLYFMRARYYSADAAVFLSTDPVKGVGSTWATSTYLYTLGNPLSFVDSNGLEAEAYYLLDKNSKTSVFKHGHAAVLICTDTCSYYSKDASGVTGQEFNTFQDFQNSLVAKRYTDQLRYDVNNGDAESMMATANARYGTIYNAANNNCNDYAMTILNSGGAAKVENVLTPNEQFKELQKQVTGNINIPSTNTKTNYTAKDANVVAENLNNQNTPTPAKGKATNQASYTIKAGDTLSGIAAKYGTTVAALQNANGIKNANVIRTGATISISKGGTK